MSLEHPPARARLKTRGGALMASGREPLTMSIPEAGKLLGLGRNSSYAAAQRGEFPVLWFGRIGRVPVAAFLRMLEEAGRAPAQRDERQLELSGTGSE
jgi:hypothetical protein